MGMYTGRLWPFVLAILLGMGAVACDGAPPADDSEESQEEDDEEATDEEEEEGEAEDEEAAEDSDLPFYATGPIARVDGEEIGKEKFNEMVRERVERMPMQQIPPMMVEHFKSQSLNFAVDKFLIDRVLEDVDIEVTEADVQEAFEEFKSRFGDDDMFEQQLQQMGMTKEEMLEGMEKDVKLEMYLSETHEMDVSDEEIRAYFEEHEDRFARPAEVRARHILIEVDEGADEATVQAGLERAQSIYEKAAGGDDFAELAKEHSEGPTGPRGGDLGFFSEGRMVPQFSEVAFSMEPGEISEPVRTQFGFHVIKVEEKRDASDPNFEDAAPEIEMQLGHQKRQEIFMEFLAELKEDVEIEILEENITVTVDMDAMPEMPHGHGHDHGGQMPQLQLGD